MPLEKHSATLLSLLTSLLFLLSSCCNTYERYSCYGADEFVTDSYKIREGKLSILEMGGVELQEVCCEWMEEYVDHVAEDDVLNIAIYHPTRKDLINSVATINNTIGFRVRQGMISIPDLPPVHVADLTLDEAKEVLEKAFREQINEIEVFLTYKDRLSRKIELSGLIGATRVPVDGKIRLYETLTLARLSPAANLFASYVMRDECKLAIDLHRLMNEGDLTNNIVMRGGDKIFIANTPDASVVVMGEVFRPQLIPLPYGHISLRSALVGAGGIPFTGDRRHIQVIRGSLLDPKIYTLSWNHIIHLPNESLLLMPGDTVYISEKPITQWNRFISQILPSANALQTGYTTYKIVSN